VRRCDQVRVALALVIVCAAGVARADRALKVADDKRVTLGDIVIEVDNGLFARRGKLSAPLRGAPFRGGGLIMHRLTAAKVSDDGESVTLGYEDFCTGFAMHFTKHQVEARLTNVAGLELHRKHQWAAAAQRFTEALGLDPDFDLAAFNLASALALDGKVNDAVKAIGPWLAQHPIETYLHVLADPELAALVDTPELRAIRASKPGTATVATTKQVAFSPERKLVAARRTEACGMSGKSWSYLALADLSGTTEELLALSDCDAPSKTDIERADRFLADLGFEPVADLDTGKQIDNTRFRFPKRKLGVMSPGRAGGGVVRVVRGNTVLAERTSSAEFLESAVFIPAVHAVVVGWVTEQPEAECGNPPPYSGIDVLVVP
jgi:hypothetical protein